jgi:gamma-glutamylcyclotransferase (GGCT)/AIG2-like uncharacterized protein YtfP
MALVRYFAYGTTQKGFSHHRQFADLLGDPVRRVRTMSSHAVVVPRRAACSNPGCPYVHRMAVLVSGFAPRHVEGDLFLIPTAVVSVIDRLETGCTGLEGPYVRARITVVSLDGDESYAAQAYFAREPARWQALVQIGEADALETYPRDLATAEVPKDCCIRTPGHPPPHDVVDPLERRSARIGSPMTPAPPIT